MYVVAIPWQSDAAVEGRERQLLGQMGSRTPRDIPRSEFLRGPRSRLCLAARALEATVGHICWRHTRPARKPGSAPSHECSVHARVSFPINLKKDRCVRGGRACALLRYRALDWRDRRSVDVGGEVGVWIVRSVGFQAVLASISRMNRRAVDHRTREVEMDCHAAVWSEAAHAVSHIAA